MSKKAIVLSSGGVDSTTCLAMAIKELGKDNVSTLTVSYGQKHEKEMRSALEVADYYKVPHYTVDLSPVFKFSNCSLLRNSTEDIPQQSYAEQIAQNGEGMVATYVPFRNGLFLSSVAALAMSIYPDDEVDVYIGAHADDAAGEAYADCSEPFVDAMREAIRIGTYDKVTVKAPLVNLNKAGVVKIGLELRAPYHLTWSCYAGGEVPCGKCGTCIDRAAAFAANGVEDPALSKEVMF